MTDLEIGHLEILLDKLQTYLGHRIVIITYAIQDGIQLGTYTQMGLPIKGVTAATLKEAIEKITQ